MTLLLGSLLFYFLGEPKYTLLLVLSTLVDYSHSRVIVRHRGSRKAKFALVSSIVINLSMLILFKYADFIIVTVNQVFSTSIPLWHLELPIGISFFTFQTMSYTIDVYREEAEVQDSVLGLATYVTLFPQLIAGPIVRYKTIAKEINERSHGFDQFSYGVFRFVIGLSKKVLIANSLGELATRIYSTQDMSVLYLWVSVIAFAFQIYYDFSGYSDMAIGLGSMFGFHFPENFNYPFTARSVSEFWRRWHISLGNWFRDYLYIPLGGNRGSLCKVLRNIIIVWFLTGFWHGASWNFILWGIFFAVLLILEKFFLKEFLAQHKYVSHVYLLFTIVVSFVFFRNTNLTVLMEQLKGMFLLTDIPLVSQEALYYLKSYFFTFVFAIIGATPMLSRGYRIVKERHSIIAACEAVIMGLLLLVVTGYLVDSSFNPFLYFRF